MIKLLKPVLPAFLGLLACLPATLEAQEIFSWVDEDGVQHFSEVAPEDSSNDVRKLEIDGSQPADYDPEVDRYNIAAQQEATQAVWDQLEESKKEQQKQRERELERQAQTQVIYYPQPDYGYGNSNYWPYLPSRPPHTRPPFRPPGKPTHPIELPEVQPPYSRPFRPPGR